MLMNLPVKSSANIKPGSERNTEERSHLEVATYNEKQNSIQIIFFK